MIQVSYKKIIDNLFDGVYFVDSDRVITYWNPAAERITGYSKDEVIGSRCSDNLLKHIDMNGNDLCINGCPLSAAVSAGSNHESSIYFHHKLGHRVPVSVRTSPVRGDSGEIIGAVEIFTDNSSVVQIILENEELKNEVCHDQLTGIPNRKYAEMALTARIFESREQNIPFGLLFIDIDHFKKINDICGHNTGDEVLKMVSNSIAGSLRKMDVIARWGGEEFIVILPGVSPIILSAIAERIRMLIESSFMTVGENNISVTISTGGTISRSDDSIETIVCRTDKLMYSSKANGRNMVTLDTE